MRAHWTPWFKSRLVLMGLDNLLFLLYQGVIVYEFYQDDKNRFGPEFKFSDRELAHAVLF